ncbi:MAG: BlaI/MecI/CopY family transcriptional regulator [Muribaculaceae bacterium]|nr:BlaI/MecI/CopY family transcriptional regulator [Muribaculaceae bacterium]
MANTRKGNKKLTEKESEIMSMLWQEGPMSVRQMLEKYPDPKPHFNTVSTTVRILEDKGYVSHEAVGNTFRYFAVADMADFRDRSFTQLVKNYFNNSYTSVVSALVKDEKISIDELKEIIRMIENEGRED